MSTSEPKPVEGIDLPTTAEKLGVDLRGFTHYWSAYTRVVYVFDGADPVRQRGYDDAAAGVAIASWINDVEEQVGWLELDHPNEEMSDWLLDELGDAVGGDDD